MAHDADLIQTKWIKSKGKGPSLIDLSNEVESLKIMIKELTRKVDTLERRELLMENLPID